MTARAGAVTLSLAATVAISIWLLAQFALSGAAGRDLAEVARQGARLLPLVQLLSISLVAPWLYQSSRDLRAVNALLLFVLIPLPVLTLLVLMAQTPIAAAGISLVSIMAWGLLLLGAAALLSRTRLSTFTPFSLTLVQAGALAIVWRTGSDWIQWIGVP